jgi:HRDC domain-containing protein
VLRFSTRVAGYRCTPGNNGAQLSAQYARSGSDSDHGFNISSEFSTSPPRAVEMLPDFHGVSRATRPYRTATEVRSSQLEEALRSWRLAEARRRGIPAFRVFTDRAPTSHRRSAASNSRGAAHDSRHRPWPPSNNMVRTSIASFVDLGFEFWSLCPAHTGVPRVRRIPACARLSATESACTVCKM